MADDHDGLLREVEEELRREQLEKLWQRYNALIIGAAALIVLAVGGYQWLETRRIAAEQAAGAEFSAAENLSDDKKNTDAEKAFSKIAASGPAGYAALAKLHLAGAEVKAGKTADAIATYETLAKDPGADDLLKSFAQLQAASLRLPDADYAEMKNRLTPLAGDDAPFGDSARELLGIAAYKAKKYDEARNYLEPLLLDRNATQELQDRVKVIMADIASTEVGGTAGAKTPAAEKDSKATSAPAAKGEPAQANANAKPDAPASTGAEPAKKP